MVADRRRALTDDLLSEMIRADDDGDRLNADELRMLVAALLMADTDTTRHQLAASVQVLCDHPGQWALLGNRPELAAAAVEETIRHSPIAVGALRTALDDVELAGVLIPAGTLVLANTAAANRDPAVYDDPDRLDITRAGAMEAADRAQRTDNAANRIRTCAPRGLGIAARTQPRRAAWWMSCTRELSPSLV